jgi:hypothetical protein
MTMDIPSPFILEIMRENVLKIQPWKNFKIMGTSNHGLGIPLQFIHSLFRK